MGLKNILSDNVATLTLTSMIGTFGNGIWTFLMPFYFVETGVSILAVGVIFTFYTIAGSFGSIIGGLLSDKYGRKKIIVFSSLIGTFSRKDARRTSWEAD